MASKHAMAVKKSDWGTSRLRRAVSIFNINDDNKRYQYAQAKTDFKRIHFESGCEQDLSEIIQS
jgi:hypothetical protein